MQLPVSGHPHARASPPWSAVKQWKYKPVSLEWRAQSRQKPPALTVNFTLADKPAEGTVGSVPGGISDGEKGGIAPTTAEPVHPAVPGRVRVSSGVAQVLLVSKVPPQYPQDAKDQRIQGSVVMKVTIDKEGNVANIELISGHPLLAPPAIDAVKQWKYKPYQLNQTPVEVETQVTVNFTLMP